MTTVIIGAGGFLGSAIVNHLRVRDEEIITMSYRPELTNDFLIEFEALLKSVKPSAVINAGASQNGKDNPSALEELITSNVFMPAAMASLIRTHALEACLLTFGTSWQIGESGANEPFNAYAASKTALEPFLDHFSQDGLRVASLRLYDTYGPRDKRNKIVNLIADALISGQELPMSPGGQMIDLVYIDDVLEAIDITLNILKSADNTGIHSQYSVRSSKPITILELLSIMKDAAGIKNADFIKPGIYNYRARERFSLHAGIPTPPGWAPRVSIEEGVKRVLADRC